MTESPKASFTKLIVDDEEAQAGHCHQVYGLNVVRRVRDDESAAGGASREVILGPGETMSGESPVMIKFIGRPTPRDQEAIPGFFEGSGCCGRARAGPQWQACRTGQVEARTWHPRDLHHRSGSRLSENVELTRR